MTSTASLLAAGEILKQDSLGRLRTPVANRPFSHDCISFQPAQDVSLRALAHRKQRMGDVRVRTKDGL
jgi:hypothetical protein